MFELHQRLTADTTEILALPLCRVLLMRDKTWPWLILVPGKPGLRHLHDLEESEFPVVMAEIALASQVLEMLYQPDKINVAALGNVVDQLHIHVIARYKNDPAKDPAKDPAWPAPVWGHAPAVDYSEAERTETTAKLIQQFNS